MPFNLFVSLHVNVLGSFVCVCVAVLVALFARADVVKNAEN